MAKKISVKDSEVGTNRYFIYQKNRRDFEPITDIEINNQAKKRLDEIYKTKQTIIPKRFLEKWEKVALFNAKGNVVKANSLFITDEEAVYDLGNLLNDLSSKEWLTETVTVFTQKGLGAGSKDAQIERLHPAPFSFLDVAKLMRFFTKEGQTVLDPFAGVGSSMKACAFENRIGIGFELNTKYQELAIERINIEVPDAQPFKSQQTFLAGDCRKLLKNLEKDSIDFIITSPPYWNILETVDHKVKQNRVANDLDIKYSEDELDFGNIETYDAFIEELSTFFDDCGNCLKSKKYMVVIISDFRKKEKYHLFHSDLAQAIERKGNFNLKGIRILHQKFKSIYPYGYPFSFVPNVHHQNVLILQKIK